MTSLYELTAQFRGLQEAALDPDLPPEAFADTMEALTGEFTSKAEGIHAVLTNMDVESCGLKKEIDRLTKRKRAADNGNSRLREYLRAGMEASGIPKIKTPLFTMSLTKPKTIVVIDDEDQIPSEWMRINRAPDRTALKEALSNGEQITGAHLGEGQSGLAIR